MKRGSDLKWLTTTCTGLGSRIASMSWVLGKLRRAVYAKSVAVTNGIA
jgi:hypothetical protein